jgi:hypothetical protein
MSAVRQGRSSGYVHALRTISVLSAVLLCAESSCRRGGSSGRVSKSADQLGPSAAASSLSMSSAWLSQDSLMDRYLGPLADPWKMARRERESFDAAMRDLEGQPPEMVVQLSSGPRLREEADLYRLDDSSRGRYLVVGSIVGADSVSTAGQEIALYVLDLTANRARFSAPYDVGTSNTDAFGLKALTDVDGDGLADVLYCQWSDSTDYERGIVPAQGKLVGVGYRRGQWYGLPDAKLPPIDCSRA